MEVLTKLTWETQTRISFFTTSYFYCSLFALTTSCSSFLVVSPSNAWAILHVSLTLTHWFDYICAKHETNKSKRKRKRTAHTVWHTTHRTSHRISSSEIAMPKYTSESCHFIFTSVTVIYTWRVFFSFALRHNGPNFNVKRYK